MNKEILVVDDDKELCEELSEFLSGEGFNPQCAQSYATAKELLKTNTFAAVLLDFKLPQATGVEFLEECGEKLKGSKVFIISGNSLINKLLAERGLAHLVTGVFNKPFAAQALLEKMK